MYIANTNILFNKFFFTSYLLKTLMLYNLTIQTSSSDLEILFYNINHSLTTGARMILLQLKDLRVSQWKEPYIGLI